MADVTLLTISIYSTIHWEVEGGWTVNAERLTGRGLIQHCRCVPSRGSSEISMFFLTFVWSFHVCFHPFSLFIFSPSHFTPFHSCLTASVTFFPRALASHPGPCPHHPAARGVRQPLTHVAEGCQSALWKAKQNLGALIHHFYPSVTNPRLSHDTSFPSVSLAKTTEKWETMSKGI